MSGAETKAKHTPGPYWRHMTATQHQVKGAHGKIIRRYPRTDEGELAAIEDVRRLQKDFLAAEQTLRDAAPDLLAALKKIVFDWDGEPEDMIEARAAIAKAEGRS